MLNTIKKSVLFISVLCLLSLKCISNDSLDNLPEGALLSRLKSMYLDDRKEVYYTLYKQKKYHYIELGLLKSTSTEERQFLLDILAISSYRKPLEDYKTILALFNERERNKRVAEYDRAIKANQASRRLEKYLKKIKDKGVSSTNGK